MSNRHLDKTYTFYGPVVYSTDDFVVTDGNSWFYMHRKGTTIGECRNPMKSHGSYERWYQKMQTKMENRQAMISCQIDDLMEENSKLQRLLDD